MKKKIIFQKCNFNYIYFLIYIVAHIIITFIDYFLEPKHLSNMKEESITYFHHISNQIINIYSFNISDFIAIIPHFIRKKLSKNHNEIKKEEENTDNENTDNGEQNLHKVHTQLIYNESKLKETQNKQKTVVIYLILIGVFDFLKDFMFVLYYLIFKNNEMVLYPFNYTVIFDIILQFVCSYLILKIHFYKLQHFSLYLNVVILIIILALDLIDILKYKTPKGYMYLIYPLYLIFFCLEYVYGKKAILYGYISMYILIIIKGIIKLIIVIVFSVFVLIFGYNIFSIISLYFKETSKILLIVGKIITHFFSVISLWIIIDRFSPNYTPLIIIGEEICNFGKDLITKNHFSEMGWYKYIRIVLYVFSFIGVMLHNEIVVVNICGLSSDTKYFYDNLVKSEEEYMKADDPDILKRFESIDINEYQDEDSVTNGTENQNNN